MTNGYSPAMIEQVCSMALTYAHSEAREEFDRKDIVEAMTTIESGTAVGVNYIEEESRAVAIHEAGHAVASHVYMNDVLSTRLSIRMRGGSLGHHQAIQKEERFSSWRHEEVGNLVWTLGAMAAEHVFYGENSNGVGGDIQSATWIASRMVGMSGMGPEPLDLRGRVAKERLPEVEKELMERFERIGLRIMNRARMGSAMDSDPIGSVLGDPAKRSAAAQILGQAYLTAVCCIRANREAVAGVADALVQHKELYGDEVVELLRGRRPARARHRRPRREHLAQGMSESDDRDRAPSGPGIRRARSPSTIRPRCCPRRGEPLLPPDADVVESDAIDEDGGDLLPERHRAAGAPAVAAAAGGSAYAPRFQFMTGALVAVGIAALIGHHRGRSSASRRRPAAGRRGRRGSRPRGGLQGATEIAGHVAAAYRDHGKQLVKVEANDISYKGMPLLVALRKSRRGRRRHPGPRREGRPLPDVRPGGELPDRRAASPRNERRLLLRREGLELALYTFRYLSDVKQVVVLIPRARARPRPSRCTSAATRCAPSSTGR